MPDTAAGGMDVQVENGLVVIKIFFTPEGALTMAKLLIAAVTEALPPAAMPDVLNGNGENT